VLKALARFGIPWKSQTPLQFLKELGILPKAASPPSAADAAGSRHARDRRDAVNTLLGKKALVTGGASGLGEAVTRELAALGAEVVIHFRSSEGAALKLKADLEAVGAKAHTVRADLTEEPQIKHLLEETRRLVGRLDCLVNNAGDLVGRRRLSELNPAFLEAVLKVNVHSLIGVTRHALPMLEEGALRGGGASVVNLASLAGRKGGHPGSLAYAAAKGAVLTVTRALSAELADRGTRFHAVHTTRESAEQTIAGIPLGRAGTPEDVGRVVAFLCSEYNGFMTGATVDINGGVYCA
jgi:3-oxoacyl-[acyl-carrier protein] reductase